MRLVRDAVMLCCAAFTMQVGACGAAELDTGAKRTEALSAWFDDGGVEAGRQILDQIAFAEAEEPSSRLAFYRDFIAIAGGKQGDPAGYAELMLAAMDAAAGERLTLIQRVDVATVLMSNLVLDPSRDDQQAAYRRAEAQLLKLCDAIEDALDEEIDLDDPPALHATPPPETRLPPGTAPSAIEDPDLRARYEASIAELDAAAAHYNEQVELMRERADFYAKLRGWLVQNRWRGDAKQAERGIKGLKVGRAAKDALANPGQLPAP